MPSPKSGTPGNIVPPAPPGETHDADKADPGEVSKVKTEQMQAQSGKYGATKLAPPGYTNDDGSDIARMSWIEIELKDEDKQPLAGEPYRVILPDSTAVEGTLDQNGFARIDEIPEGNCKVCFPELSADAWRKV